MSPGADALDVSRAVRDFYEVLPFNCARDVEEQARLVAQANQVQQYPPLAALLEAGAVSRALDVGCGVGWLPGTLARWYGVSCTAVDFCERALQRAAATARQLGVAGRVELVQADLFDLPRALGPRAFELVTSIGVLHHTADAPRAFASIAPFVAPGGHVLVGLYHRHGRRALLDLFRPIRERLAGARTEDERRAIEDEGLERWRALHDAGQDEVFLRSWFRDQCLHPHETQWTLADVLRWFAAAGLRPVATSLDRFQASPAWDRVVAGEAALEEVGRRAIHDERRFFPGFFVVLGRREPLTGPGTAPPRA